jgi:K+-transporting ATPase ATPase C chain
MIRVLRRSLILSLIFLVVLGLAYPAVEVAINSTLFPRRAAGSITPYGSPLIGQHWTGQRWFHGRPDADNPLATGGTNLGPRSKELLYQTKALIKRYEHLGVTPTEELVTTSGSGVDPDISPQSAYIQVPLVAKATGISTTKLDELIHSQIQGPDFSILGQRYVDVLKLNEALAHLEARIKR